MTHASTVSSIPPAPSLEAAWQDVHSSFERFCLTAGIGALERMLREDAERLAGPRHSRNRERAGRRWGATKGKMGFHGGKAAHCVSGRLGGRFSTGAGTDVGTMR